LWRDDFINREQWSLAKVCFLRIGVGIGCGRARGFTLEVSGIVIAATIGDLGSKPREQCLCAFCAVNHMELAFGLRSYDALFQVVVAQYLTLFYQYRIK